MTFVYDPVKPRGSRIVSAMVGGKTFDRAASYAVATNDYIVRGDDGYSALKGGKLIVDAAGVTLMASQVMDYITAFGTIEPKIEGRIKTN
jgi:2',3'-cyclic-nucleotide 2'-phosphodiesterase (5'-nucleotidase family)